MFVIDNIYITFYEEPSLQIERGFLENMIRGCFGELSGYETTEGVDEGPGEGHAKPS
jgi:hypothetical protein